MNKKKKIMPPRNFTDEEEVEIGKIYLAGFSTKAIGRAYKLPGKDSILGALRRQGIEQRSPAERNRLYKVDAHTFDVIDTEEKAYWWGFIYADGNVYKRSLSLMLKISDKPHIEKFKHFLNSEHPIRHYMAKVDGKKYPNALFYATDRHLAERLKELGIVPKRTIFKKAIAHLPDKFKRDWIRGLFDGDGSAGKPCKIRGPSIRLCGSRIMMIWARKTIADEIGTNPKLKVSKHSIAALWYLHFSGNRVAPRVANWLYDGATIYLSRKKEVVDNW